MLFSKPCIRLLATVFLLSISDHASAQSLGFDSREATIASVHHALFTGLSSCREVVSSFLTRIETHNPRINAIIALNPSALATADALDHALSLGNTSTGPLFCVPILLKDNFDLAGLPTTGGNLALSSLHPSTSAPTVAALQRAGAVVLGKANLHELALEGLTASSLGGQTLNPYDAARTPGGSSGGSGAAVAASFAVLATGTDTVNSLRSPASANNLFSVRPTRGLLSRGGVVPISYTQDAVGVMARSLEDVAVALTAMAGVGYDEADNATALIPEASVGVDYAAELAGASSSLEGVRLGLLEPFFNRSAGPETDPVNEAMDTVVGELAAAGATIVRINDTELFNATGMAATLDTQRFEYRESLEAYLQNSDHTSSSPASPFPRTLASLYATNNTSGSGTGNGSFLVIPAQYEYVTTALRSSTANATYSAVQSGIRNLTLALAATMSAHRVSALLYPEQRNLVVPVGAPSQSGRNGILAALTGSPVVCVPIGFSGGGGGEGSGDEDASLGVPIGMEVLGRPWDERTLFGVAKGVREAVGPRARRRTPGWATGFVEGKVYESVPVMRPDRGNVPDAYPLGVL
ncbi:amidase signature enzyme [Diplodia corticola]|uniref:Amidase signature enzyme n=1 Tax=Diplodia corticola TaxID=236234 RepID=A0A1J9QZ69_9PEZI|nr:amidase signature enzyme [Diplodia corticola]OJD33274.1 amidase signature enzyme [Diplodia corticola]